MKAVQNGFRVVQALLRTLGVFAFALASLVTFCYLRRETNLLTVRYRIETSKLKEGTSFQLVSLSDYHNHGLSYSNETLLEAIENENPDAVVMTGDMVDSHTERGDFKELRRLASFLKEKAYPSFFVSGNHEEDAPKRIREASYEIYRETGVFILSGEAGSVSLLKEGEASLRLFGFEDPGYGYEDQTGLEEGSKIDLQAKKMNLKERDFNVLLSHQPCYFERAKRMGFDLTLSGHTHAGQITVFGYPLLSLPWTKYERGKYEEMGKTLLISNGLGESYQMPFRYRCPYTLLSVTIAGIGR